MGDPPEREESDDEGFLSDYATSHLKDEIIKARQTGEVYKLTPEQMEQYKEWFPDDDDSDSTVILNIDEEASSTGGPEESQQVALPQKMPEQSQQSTTVTVRCKL